MCEGPRAIKWYVISLYRNLINLIITSGCGHATVPAQSQRLITIAYLFISRLNITNLLVADNTTNNNATFKFSETNQPVNSSLCNISSLEVYRGREQAIEISHDGFSLSNSGSIEVIIELVNSILQLLNYRSA